MLKPWRNLSKLTVAIVAELIMFSLEKINQCNDAQI